MRGDTESLSRQLFHHDHETPVFLAEQCVGREPHVIKEQQRRIRGMLADLVDLLGFLKPRTVRVDQKQGRAFGAFTRVRDGRHDDEVGVDPIGNEDL